MDYPYYSMDGKKEPSILFDREGSGFLGLYSGKKEQMDWIQRMAFGALFKKKPHNTPNTTMIHYG